MYVQPNELIHQDISAVFFPPNVITKPQGMPPQVVFQATLQDGRTYQLMDEQFVYNYIPYLNCQDRYQLFFGGYGSGKSQFIIGQRIVLDVVFNNRNFVCVRQFKADIERSIYNEILEGADILGLGSLFYATKNPFKILCTANGRTIDFFGTDEPERVKSYKPAKGVLTDVVIEEATEIPSKKVFDLIDSRLRGIDRTLPLDKQVPKRMTLLFNPEGGIEHWIYKEFFLGKFTSADWEKRYKYPYNKVEAFKAIKASNPSLDDKSIEKIMEEESKHYNVMMLRTVHNHNRFLTPSDHIRYSGYQGDQKTVGQMGWWATSGDIVFKQGVHWKTADLSKHEVLNPKHGLDFGYDPDPFAYVKIDYDKKNKIIYVVNGLDGILEQNPAIAEAVFPYAGREPINCDSAEKKSIEELKSRKVSGKYALNARAVRKASGIINKRKLNYVEFKIQWLKQHLIVVDKRLKGIIAELDSYSRKRNRNGELTNSFIGADHYIDAISYALNDEMFNIGRGITTSNFRIYNY